MRRAALLLACSLGACSLPSSDAYVADYHEDGSEPVGSARSALSDTDPVSAAVTDTGCSTTIVKKLSRVITTGDRIGTPPRCWRPSINAVS